MRHEQLNSTQGLTWSTTVIMKIDLAGPNRRGLDMGSTRPQDGAAAAILRATGWLAAQYGWQPGAFVLGAAYVAMALGLSVCSLSSRQPATSTWKPSRISAVKNGLSTLQAPAALKTASLNGAPQACRPQLPRLAAQTEWIRRPAHTRPQPVVPHTPWLVQPRPLDQHERLGLPKMGYAP
jgi:hypothetical protein